MLKKCLLVKVVCKVADCKKFCMNVNRNNQCNVFFKKKDPYSSDFSALRSSFNTTFKVNSKIVFCSSTKLLADYSNPHPGIASTLPFLRLREEHCCRFILYMDNCTPHPNGSFDQAPFF